MNTWIVTGISGSGRTTLLKELAAYANRDKNRVKVHDVGELLRDEFERNDIPVVDERILNTDRSLLKMGRCAVVKDIQLQMLRNPDIQCHLIGVHATFRWKGRLIPGISFQDILGLQPDGFMTVVDDVKGIYERNRQNPKWDKDSLPTLEETQEWMIEEEFVTEIFAEVRDSPFYLVAADHTPSNLADLLFTNKKKLYLSFPITAVQHTNPELIEQVQGPILQKLQEHFIVFNPWWVEDMPLTGPKAAADIPDIVEQLTEKAIDTIKKRTIERDFQFIDQADAVAVFYLTEKVSPGVLAEVYYAHRTQKPVFMAFPGSRSPFLEDAVTALESDIETLLLRMEEFASGV